MSDTNGQRYPGAREATPEQRPNFEIIGDGHGIHWPDIDEDISPSGMFFGVPARRPGMA
jgi:hypothetical protein